MLLLPELRREHGLRLMEQTRYFEQVVLVKRDYLKVVWCEQTVREPEATEVQSDGRVRYWRYIPELGKHLRVVTEAGKLHNAFPDRSYRPPEPPES